MIFRLLWSWIANKKCEIIWIMLNFSSLVGNPPWKRKSSKDQWMDLADYFEYLIQIWNNLNCIYFFSAPVGNPPWKRRSFQQLAIIGLRWKYQLTTQIRTTNKIAWEKNKNSMKTTNRKYIGPSKTSKDNVIGMNPWRKENKKMKRQRRSSIYNRSKEQKELSQVIMETWIISKKLVYTESNFQSIQKVAGR